MGFGRKWNVDDVAPRTTIDQDTITADAQSTGVDVTDLAGRGVLLVSIGVPNNADNTIQLVVQESSDDGVADAYADVSGAASGIRTADVAELVEIEVDFDEVEAFLRISYEDVAGTGPSYEVAVVAISSRHVLPTG